MKYIVYDLEFTVLKRQSMSEIIEIGAVKVNENNQKLEIVDMFQTFIRPHHYTTLTNMTTHLTGIVQDDINRAPNFIDAMNHFIEWIGNENYYLVSWGPDDKLQLLRHCNQYKQSFSWIKNHNDLQEQISQKLNGTSIQRIGLTKAMEQLEIEFEGRQHRAINDAFNTAKILIKTFPDLKFGLNEPSADIAYTSTLVYKSGVEERNFPFEELKKLMGKLG